MTSVFVKIFDFSIRDPHQKKGGVFKSIIMCDFIGNFTVITFDPVTKLVILYL